MARIEPHAHWDRAYREKAAAELSWTQAEPEPSRTLIREVAAPGDSIIDVGGGASPLAGRLVEEGLGPVTVLDLCGEALRRAQQALGPSAERITWIEADITEVRDVGPFFIWHDRAVFHFLTDAGDRGAYLSQCVRMTTPGGLVIIGAFALDGPERCSGLPVRRYDAEGIASEFGKGFAIERRVRATHHTPWGAAQPFEFVRLRRTPAAGSE